MVMDTQEIQTIKNRFSITGNDPALNRALEIAVAIAPNDLTVLITGESGVGKEVIPQIIHQFSRRKNGKYLAVNCGALPEGTINAELFGHEKGSFTGAIGERKGYFEEADGGTLFLDEVGELPKETQALLLRVLQSGEFMKVGSSKVEKTDVRVICATNVDLSYAVATGKFRQDLYYRLNTVIINMPPLRERKGDIYLLFRKFTSDFAQRYQLCPLDLNHEAIGLLNSYRWPGNIRQLKNVAEAVTALESRQVTPTSRRIEIGPSSILPYIPDEKDTLLPAAASCPSSSGGGGLNDSEKQAIFDAIVSLKKDVDKLKLIVNSKESPETGYTQPPRQFAIPDYEPEEQYMTDESQPQEAESTISIRKASDDLIERALARHGGKVKPAAAELGISERTIYRKLAEKKGK